MRGILHKIIIFISRVRALSPLASAGPFWPAVWGLPGPWATFLSSDSSGPSISVTSRRSILILWT